MARMSVELQHPIAAYRARERLTVGELAARINVSRVTIWRWEQGRVPDPEMWPAITAATPITRQQLSKYAMAMKYPVDAA